MGESSTLPLNLLPIICISTLSIIVRDLSHLIALLLCILLAHNNFISTDTTLTSEETFQYEVTILVSYIPIILSIANARILASSNILSQTLARNPVLKIGLKSMLPASLSLVYGSVVMIILRPVMQEHQILQYQLAIFIFFWATYNIFVLEKKEIICSYWKCDVSNGEKP